MLVAFSGAINPFWNQGHKILAAIRTGTWISDTKIRQIAFSAAVVACSTFRIGCPYFKSFAAPNTHTGSHVAMAWTKKQPMTLSATSRAVVQSWDAAVFFLAERANFGTLFIGHREPSYGSGATGRLVCASGPTFALYPISLRS